jgi:ketosteroid isomerase-like protein
MSGENAEVVRWQFDGFERGDLDAVAELWHPDIDWRAVEGAADDVGVIRGTDRLRRYYQDWIDMFDELRAEVEDVIFEANERVAVVVHNSGRGRSSGLRTEGRYYVACKVRDGRILSGREYESRDQALEAVRLWELAQRVEPKATWNDLAVPKELLNLLGEIADEPALFVGDRDACATASEAIASHRGLDLYRVDLSAVVSKYIGETEKNLRRVFDAAEAGGAILVFDEADALFGKRSEVKDSHDRYANAEIDYLLERMEAHRGLVILCADLEEGHQKLLRRFRLVVRLSESDD